jgi:hypothetical protein
MTSSAEPTLDELIDRLFEDKTWHAIRLFNGKHPNSGGGNLACIARDHSTATVDQLPTDASPSAKLRNVLTAALKLKPPHADPPKWDGGYTDDLADEWLDEQFKNQPVDDFDDILG